MAVTIGTTQKRLGLALSGGGFRAAAFHLGVFRKLRALGLLDKLDVLSCVSGGSIAGSASVMVVRRASLRSRRTARDCCG